MKVTIKQIAEIAGVHRSTVDKVLHDREGVSPEVSQRVKNIIDELGYKPNIFGKALACQNKPLLIAVMLLKVDAIEEIKVGIEVAYSEYNNFGLKIEYYLTNNLDEEEQLHTLKLLKNKKISGLIISPLLSESVKSAIDDIVDTGVPVVTINSDIPNSKRMCFVGQSMSSAGRVAGELMGEILNGNGKVAIITSTCSLWCSSERQKTFETVIEERYPGIKIVDVIETFEQRMVSFQKTLTLLKSVEDLKGIYITCGTVGEVGKAVKLLNKARQVKIISFDLYPEIVELVKEGIINFTIGQDLFGQGYKSVKVLFEFLFFNQKTKTEHIKTAIDIRLKENIVL